MFYVSPNETDAAMSTAKLVQKKVASDEVCLQCVECVLITSGKRSLRFAAVIERQDEYSVFLYSTTRVPCLQSGDLNLEQTIPIDSRLRCHAEAPPKLDKPQPDFLLGLKSPDVSITLEMPQQESTQMFLAEIRRALDLTSQNSAFGSPPEFAWLKKYQIPSDDPMGSRNSGGSDDNPFADDVFDPMRHMNLTQTNSHVVASDVASTTKTKWFDGEMETLSLKDMPVTLNANLTSGNKSLSRASLDNILNDEMTGSLDSLQTQLGISAGAELAIGSQPSSRREKYLRKYLTDREVEFTDIKSFKVFAGTWNVNGKSPMESLQKWLVVDNDPPDIYAIGFQELDLSKEAFIFSDSQKEAEWQTAVRTHLHPKAKYRKIKSIRLVGVMLIVYIQEQHVPNISFIDADSVATGIMGFVGNKGGVSIRFTFYSTSLCFVNAHLAAHQDEYERRNSDYRDIESKTRFKQFEPPLEIPEHDIVIWTGDLNYRIDLPLDEVKDCIKKGLFKRLSQNDQLIRQMQLAGSDVFKGYEEGLLTFDPSYKFDIGTDKYDSSEKSRIPAWCDRILFRGPFVQQIRYSSHPHMRSSDHKPVSSLFSAGVRVIDQVRYKKVYEDIMKILDRFENDYLPQIKLDKTECVFKDVRFLNSQTEVVTVANIGQAPVDFEFINKLDDDSYCRPWLKVSPSKSVISAGACCEIHVEVFVDKSTASKLNCGDEKMEDILVLHLNGGKDSFITVSGNYLTSSFGSSIEALVQMHSPIREVPVASLLEFEQPGSLNQVDISQDGGRLYMVPKEIWKLVDHLHKHGLDKEELFQERGINSEIQLLRDCLDTGVPALIPESVSVHSVAESLLLFLECLGQPVVPYEFYSQCLASSNNLLLSKQLMSSLPDCHKNVFLYICAFLRELVLHAERNGLDIKFLSSMFGEVMLRPCLPNSTASQKSNAKDKKSRARDEEAKKAAFMYHFICHDIDV